MRAVTVAVALACATLAACHSDTTRVPNGPGAALPDTSAAAVGIQISPAPKPDFDLKIHDYLIDCNASSDIEVRVADPARIGFTYLRYAGPREPRSPQSPNYRGSLTLAPGQGFRVAMAGSGAYSFRCPPPDFPPLSVSIQGNPQAEWYLFTPTLGGSGPYFVIMTDAHGTPVWWSRQPVAGNLDAKVLGPDRIVWTPGFSRFRPERWQPTHCAMEWM